MDMEIPYPKVDRTAFSVTSFFDQPDDLQYWLSKTPVERLQAVMLMRQIVYGTANTSSRLQRIFEVAEFAP